MQRINTPDGNWHAGDPSQGIKGTVVTQPYMQTVQEELAAVPESVGIELDPNDNKQIVKAIQKMVADAGANYQPKLGYTPVQQGTGVGQGSNDVKIGWAKDGSGLRVTVDANDLGLLALASQLSAYASKDWVNGYAVNKAGDTMSGALTLSSTTDWSPIVFSAKGYAPRIQADNTTKSINFVNGANNAANMWIYDGGQVSVRGDLTIGGTTYAGGNNATIAPDGNVWGPMWGGWLRDYINGTFAIRTGDTFAGRVSLSKNGWQADFGLHNWRQGQDAWVYLRARDGGGLDIINSAYNGIPWQMSDAGETWQSSTAHIGGASFQTDGNVWGSIWGNDYLSNVIGRKANAGSTCQPTGEQAEFGPLRQSTNTTTVDCPDSWVMMGLRTDNWNGDAAPRTLYIRAKRMKNQ